jgi:hypothetical protein
MSNGKEGEHSGFNTGKPDPYGVDQTEKKAGHRRTRP